MLEVEVCGFQTELRRTNQFPLFGGYLLHTYILKVSYFELLSHVVSHVEPEASFRDFPPIYQPCKFARKTIKYIIHSEILKKQDFG